MADEAWPFTLARFSALLDMIYSGLEEEPLWERFLHELRIDMGSAISFLILRNPSQGDPGLVLGDGLPMPLSEQTHNIYSDELYALDPFVNLPLGKPVTLDEFLSRDSLQASEFYQRCMQPFDIQHILGVDMQIANGLRANLRITRPEDAGPFDDDDKSAIQALLPHLERAIHLYAKIHSMEAQRELLDRTVSRLSLGAIFLDEQRCVLQANTVAKAILAEGEGIALSRNLLEISNKTDARNFRELLNSAIEAHSNSQPHIVQAMSVSKGEGLPLNLVIRPLPISEAVEGQAQAAVAVFISDPEQRSRTPTETLGQLYGLTPAEARLALALADGKSLDEVSSSLFISRNTARAHLRAIFSKTGVTQQTKLVTLVLKSVAAALGDNDTTK